MGCANPCKEVSSKNGYMVVSYENRLCLSNTSKQQESRALLKLTSHCCRLSGLTPPTPKDTVFFSNLCVNSKLSKPTRPPKHGHKIVLARGMDPHEDGSRALVFLAVKGLTICRFAAHTMSLCARCWNHPAPTLGGMDQPWWCQSRPAPRDTKLFWHYPRTVMHNLIFSIVMLFSGQLPNLGILTFGLSVSVP